MILSVAICCCFVASMLMLLSLLLQTLVYVNRGLVNVNCFVVKSMHNFSAFNRHQGIKIIFFVQIMEIWD